MTNIEAARQKMLREKSQSLERQAGHFQLIFGVARPSDFLTTVNMKSIHHNRPEDPYGLPDVNLGRRFKIARAPWTCAISCRVSVVLGLVDQRSRAIT